MTTRAVSKPRQLVALAAVIALGASSCGLIYDFDARATASSSSSSSSSTGSGGAAGGGGGGSGATGGGGCAQQAHGFGEQPSVAWRVQIGSDGEDGIDAVAANTADIVAITGSFEGSLDLGDGVLNAPKSPGTRGRYVAVYARNGKLRWSRYLALTVRPVFVAIDSTDSVYVAGTAPAGTAKIAGRALAVAADEREFVLRFAKDGSVDWLHQLGGIGSARIAGVAANPITDGVGYVGSFDGTLNPGQLCTGAPTQGGLDGFYAELTAAGTCTFTLPLGGTGDQTGEGIAFDDQGARAIVVANAGTLQVGAFDPVTALTARDADIVYAAADTTRKQPARVGPLGGGTLTPAFIDGDHIALTGRVDVPPDGSVHGPRGKFDIPFLRFNVTSLTTTFADLFGSVEDDRGFITIQQPFSIWLSGSYGADFVSGSHTLASQGGIDGFVGHIGGNVLDAATAFGPGGTQEMGPLAAGASRIFVSGTFTDRLLVTPCDELTSTRGTDAVLIALQP